MHEDIKLSQGPFPENTTNLHQTHKQNVNQNNKTSATPTERTTHKSLLLSSSLKTNFYYTLSAMQYSTTEYNYT